eukprot:6469983-Amphidinium_carterae.1
MLSFNLRPSPLVLNASSSMSSGILAKSTFWAGANGGLINGVQCMQRINVQSDAFCATWQHKPGV